MGENYVLKKGTWLFFAASVMEFLALLNGGMNPLKMVILLVNLDQ